MRGILRISEVESLTSLIIGIGISVGWALLGSGAF